MTFVPLHAIGGAQDLPIPAELAIAAAMAALVLSFTVLVLAWRQPRYDAATQGHPLPAGLAGFLDSPGLRLALRILGLLIGGWLAWALIAGPDLVTNPVFGSFYVLLWVGIVPFSLLFGPIFRAISPARSLAWLLSKATGGDPDRGLRAYPASWGYYPAAIGLFGFVWQELVNPQAAFLGSVRLWLAVYLAAMLFGAAVFGSAWLERADPFEAYSTLVAKLCPIGRTADGTLVWRSPLASLDGYRAEAGSVAMLCVLFGSTAFDSFKEKLVWARFLTDGPLPEIWLNTLALATFCLVVLVTFVGAAVATGAHTDLDRTRLPRALVASLVPIIVGYMVAHYLTFFVEQGQVTLIQLSDPMVQGQNLLGTGNWSVNYWLSSHPTMLANTKVLAIVVGHVTGAIAAHDRALKLLPAKHAITGQLAMLVLMVAYTATGLYLLFGT